MQTCPDSAMPMKGIDIVLKPLNAVWRNTLGELAQRPKGARVPVPNFLSVAMVGVADACFEFQLEIFPEQLLDMRGITPSQRR